MPDPTTDKITVVIPSYCHERFIADAITSVGCQTYPNIQLVVIDDGSTDGSVKVIERALARIGIDDVIFETQPNTGAHAALNRGMELADGKYISVLNSDDVYHPERLARLHALAWQSKARFVFSEIEFGPPSMDVSNHTERQQQWLDSSGTYPALSYSLFRSNGTFTSSNFFFESDLVDDIGAFRDLELANDWDFVLRMIRECEPVQLNEKLLYYRQHGTNTINSRNTLRRTIDEYRRVILDYFDAISQHPPTNGEAPSPHHGERFLQVLEQPTEASDEHWAIPGHNALWRTHLWTSKGDPSPLPPHDLQVLVGSVTEQHFLDVGREFMEYFIEYCGLLPSHDVLDIGCGSGRIALHLTNYLSADGSYHGIDVVPDLIAWCQANIESHHANFAFELANVRNSFYSPDATLAGVNYTLPFPDAQFDFVCLTSVFTHLLPDDADRYVAEIRRVLRPGGRVLATFFLHNRETRRMAASGRGEMVFGENHGTYRTMSRTAIAEAAICYPEQDVRTLFGRYGLRLLDEPRYGSWCGRRDFLSFQDVLIAEKIADE